MSAKSQSLPTNIILGQSPEDFLKLYNPVSANRLLAKGFSSGEIALLPRVPRLRDVATKYGQAIATKWIEIQLLNIDSLQGQTQFSAEAKLEASNLILSAYKDMTVAELLNFFARYKLGEFTEVTQYYGGIQKVLIALRHYRTMRDDDVIRIERDREYEQAEQERRARNFVLSALISVTRRAKLRKRLASFLKTPRWIIRNTVASTLLILRRGTTTLPCARSSRVDTRR